MKKEKKGREKRKRDRRRSDRRKDRRELYLGIERRKEKGRRRVNRRENFNIETGNQVWFSSEVEDKI